MRKTKILDWLGKTIKSPKAGLHDVTTYRVELEKEAVSAASLDAYALFTVVGTIARLLSVCEFRTFRAYKEYRGLEWASLNVKPNDNQNAVEWKRELISRLLIEGEVLCIQLHDGQRIIADSFTKDDKAVYESIFSNISRGDMTFDRYYTSSDVIYLTSPVNAKQQWLQCIMQKYEKLMQSASKRFDNADGERGTLNVSALAKGDPKFEENFKALMTDYFKSYFNAKNAVLPLFEGYEYKPNSSTHSGTYTNDTTAVKVLADEALGRAAQAFGIPASYIRGDAAGIKDAQSAMLTNSIKPIAKLLSAEFTAKLYKLEEIAKGDRIEVDTGAILHHDIIDEGSKIDKLFGAGWSHNEIRQALGQPTVPEKWADEHFITKNYETIDSAMTAEGGEGNA